MKAQRCRRHREAAHRPALPARQGARRMDPGVIGDGLVLDLLDRMPTPHALRLGIGAGEMRWIGEDGVGQRRGEMLQRAGRGERSEEHTSELQSLMRISYAV